MIGTLEHMIRNLAPDSLQINIWPSESGFQINVKERASPGWTVVCDEDPVFGLNEALRQKLMSIGRRNVTGLSVPPPTFVPTPVAPVEQQIDIEDAIAAAVTADAGDDFEGLLG